MGGEEADGVVAPVVRLAPLHEEPLGDVLVHGQELDGRDAQVDEVGDGRLVRQPRVRALERGRHARVAHREALDVHLVDDRVGVAVGAVAGVGPGERPVDDQALGYVASRVECVGQIREVRVVAEDLGSERHRTGRGPGVGIEQQLGGVAPDPLAGSNGPGAGNRRPGPGRRHRRSSARPRRRSPPSAPASRDPRGRRGTGPARRRRSTPPRSSCPARTVSRRAVPAGPGGRATGWSRPRVTTGPLRGQPRRPPRGCRRHCPAGPGSGRRRSPSTPSGATHRDQRRCRRGSTR